MTPKTTFPLTLKQSVTETNLSYRNLGFFTVVVRTIKTVDIHCRLDICNFINSIIVRSVKLPIYFHSES